MPVTELLKGYALLNPHASPHSHCVICNKQLSPLCQQLLPHPEDELLHSGAGHINIMMLGMRKQQLQAATADESDQVGQ